MQTLYVLKLYFNFTTIIIPITITTTIIIIIIITIITTVMWPYIWNMLILPFLLTQIFNSNHFSNFQYDLYHVTW